MRSILEEFYYGNISPGFQNFTHNSSYAQAIDAVTGYEEELLGKLNGEEKDILKKYLDAQGEVNRLSDVESFTCGFRLGLLITAEAFATSGDLIAREG